MTIQRIVIVMCRHYSHQFIIRVEHQGAVNETVLMIVHIATINQEGTVFRLSYKRVPLVKLLARKLILPNVNHFTYSRNSS